MQHMDRRHLGWRVCTEGLVTCLSLCFFGANCAVSADQIELRRYFAPEASQAVAVDEDCFYAIGNRTIAKYSKLTGHCLRKWTGSADYPLEHINSGVVRDGKLFCAHSN